MTRVAVIGNAGGGKSTMCRALSASLGLPYHPVDRMQWAPGWTPVPDADFHALHDPLLRTEAWIIDGFGPWDAVVRRFDAADTIIVVDYPLWRHLWWATKRQVRSVVLGRPDGPEDCPMFPVTLRLYRMMWWLHRELRPRLLAEVERHRDTKAIFHIRHPREMQAFLEAHGG